MEEHVMNTYGVSHWDEKAGKKAIKVAKEHAKKEWDFIADDNDGPIFADTRKHQVTVKFHPKGDLFGSFDESLEYRINRRPMKIQTCSYTKSARRQYVRDKDLF